MSKYITILLLLVTVMSCRDEEYIVTHDYDYTDTNDDDAYNPDQVDLSTYPCWTAETHGNGVEPNISQVFPDDKVQQMYITIDNVYWTEMWSELDEKLNSNSMFNAMAAMGGDAADVDFTPMWAPCKVTYNGSDWYSVGVRFKGNSSLSQTYSDDNSKLSMKLDFDEYEYISSALTNQRFYGFNQLNLNNNYKDKSLMREKVASDLFREFGMAVAHASFCEVYIDSGSGFSYYGLYTIVEEVDDSVIKTQLTAGGNVYKPEADAGSFAEDTYDKSEFNLKTNTTGATYSDVLALYDALHSEDRGEDDEAWCAALEAAFDVPMFLRWLAVNTTIQNWDSYGNMAHNYYLYNNPDNGLLTWIPWDHNESLQSATGNYYTYTPSQLSYLSGSSWPLIRYLMDVDEYKALFYEYLAEFLDDAFVTSKMQATYQTYYELLYDSANNEVSGYTFLDNGVSDFDSAVSTLKTHAQSRYSLISGYLP